MRPRLRLLVALGVVAVSAVVLTLTGHGRPNTDGAARVARAPRIRPDYAGTVIPPNIAPLNFSIREEGTRFFVRIHSETGDDVEIDSREPQIVIPRRSWRSLLEANRGKELRFDVFVERDARWRQFDAVVNRIAEDDIDSHIAYRLIGPVHNLWRDVAIHQRDLTTYRESTVLDGLSLNEGCVNCHCFAGNDPGQMAIGTRSGDFGNSALLVNNGEVKRLGTKFGYTAWHPSGKIVTYSINKVWQFFHRAGPEVRDVVDLDAALAYYIVGSDDAKMIPRASDKERLETYPTWSPDGRYLYYCSAPFPWTDRNQVPPDHYDEVKYDLMRIAYDVDADTWGEPETVLSADETGLSILIPRISPDGRYLLFCMCRYGCFPVYQPSSDLYMMDMADGSYARLEINSDSSESYHSWSSNSRWIAFSTKRRNGLYTRCYFSYVDSKGKAHKPFIIPQKDPTYYDSLLKTVSVPELITGPVPVDARTLRRAARSPVAIEVDAVTGPSRPAGQIEPWEQAATVR